MKTKFQTLILLFILIALIANCGIVSGGNCNAWSDWKPIGEKSCDPNFWCIFKGQQALYQDYESTRQCDNAIQRKTKREKIQCGC